MTESGTRVVIRHLSGSKVNQIDQFDLAGLQEITLGRIAECEEVANLVTYLASDLAFFINGTMIEIDGGQDKVLMDRLRDR